jgi:hypothetical protein
MIYVVGRRSGVRTAKVVGQGLSDCFEEDDDVVAIARPCVADGDNAALAVAVHDLHVHTPPVVLGFRGLRLVVDGNQRAIH